MNAQKDRGRNSTQPHSVFRTGQNKPTPWGHRKHSIRLIRSIPCSRTRTTSHRRTWSIRLILIWRIRKSPFSPDCESAITASFPHKFSAISTTKMVEFYRMTKQKLSSLHHFAISCLSPPLNLRHFVPAMQDYPTHQNTVLPVWCRMFFLILHSKNINLHWHFFTKGVGCVEEFRKKIF